MTDAPFCLIQISDCHLFADIDRCGYGQINPYTSLIQVAKLAARLNPDAVLLSGDISNDCSELSYQHLANLMAAHLPGVAWHLIPGNHDSAAHMQRLFAEQQACLQQPVEMGGWMLHGLDSQFKGTLGQVDEAQLARLRHNVKQAPDYHHLVAVHHHPIACQGWMDKHAWVNSEAFLQQLDSLPGIRLVLHGHIHTDLSWKRGQSLIQACPSSCWQWTVETDFGVADEAPGLRCIRLFADGRIDSVVHRIQP